MVSIFVCRLFFFTNMVYIFYYDFSITTKYKIFEDNRYPNLASTISESFFGGYNNNEDSLLRNSNTFVDDVIEFSGGSIMNFKNAPLQNSTELRNLTEQLNKIAPHTIDFGVFMQ